MDEAELFVLSELTVIEHNFAMSTFLHDVDAIAHDTDPKSVFLEALETTRSSSNGISANI